VFWSRLTEAFYVMLVIMTAAGIVGCDREFVDVAEPEIEVIEPDVDEVAINSQTTLRVRATSFRPIDRVEANDQRMEFNPTNRVWSFTLDLSPGVNEIVIAAFDIENVAGRDTLALLYLTTTFSVSPARLPSSVGNHAAVLMTNGDVLVTGGSLTPDGEALGGAATLTPGGVSSEPVSASMVRRRVGHTMANIPDGRVLIVGGADRGRIVDVLSLIEEPELYDPVTRTFSDIPFSGAPIRRTEHTISTRQTASGFLVDLFGGVGDIRYGSTPELGIRDDVRTFLFRNDSLIALSPGVGGFLSDPIAGHTAASLTLRDDHAPDRYLIQGSFFGSGFVETTSFTVDFADPLGLLPIETETTLTPRTQHASAPLSPGIIATFGGVQGENGIAVGSIEVYVDRSHRFLRLPVPSPFLVRSRQTATKLADNRIMLIGGFDTNGNSLSLVEYFVFSAQ
jgi:hypothetical protein